MAGAPKRTVTFPDGTVAWNGQDVRAKVRELNLPKLGGGVHREVYELSETTVLKLSREKGAMGVAPGEANTTERDTWDFLRKTPHADLFAPVLACDRAGDWLVMERAEVGMFEGTARTALARLGVPDLHGGNLGTLPDGRTVAVDYGFPQGFESVKRNIKES